MQLGVLETYRIRSREQASHHGYPYPCHSCHDEWRTTVIGSHLKALEMTSDLEILRSAPTMK